MIEEEKWDLTNSKFAKGISGVFSFNQELRKQKLLANKQRYSIDSEDLDMNEDGEVFEFQRASELLNLLRFLQNPIEKLQLLYDVIEKIKEDIDSFWEGIKIGYDEKCIDAYNMGKILSYVILKSKYHEIIIDLHIIELLTGNFIDFWWSGFIYSCFSHTIVNILHQHNTLHNNKESSEKFGVINGSQMKSSDNFTESSSNTHYLKTIDSNLLSKNIISKVKIENQNKIQRKRAKNKSFFRSMTTKIFR